MLASFPMCQLLVQAYLQQELEKLQNMRNNAKLEGESWDDRISGSSVQNSHLVSKATRLWESLLARKSKYTIYFNLYIHVFLR